MLIWILCFVLNLLVIARTNRKFAGTCGAVACILMLLPCNEQYIPVFCAIDCCFSIIILVPDGFKSRH